MAKRRTKTRSRGGDLYRTTAWTIDSRGPPRADVGSQAVNMDESPPRTLPPFPCLAPLIV
eukprot:4127836-Pyramimonas_sp.AAC.1